MCARVTDNIFLSPTPNKCYLNDILHMIYDIEHGPPPCSLFRSPSSLAPLSSVGLFLFHCHLAFHSPFRLSLSLNPPSALSPLRDETQRDARDGMHGKTGTSGRDEQVMYRQAKTVQQRRLYLDASAAPPVCMPLATQFEMHRG